MKKILRITLALILAPSFLFAQSPDEVNDMQHQQEFLDSHPELHQQIVASDRLIKDRANWFETHGSATRGEVYIIPVVFHVLHENGPENISLAQIENAIEGMNDDFRLHNEDTSDIVPAFKSIAGDCEIEFRLAKLDPNGDRTDGVTRTFTDLTNDAGESSKIISWPRDKYLNIWVVASIGNGAAGYTYYPSSAQFFPSRDGIIVLHDYVGSIGTGSLRRSGTLSHEVGHWIDLPHVWASTNEPSLQSNCSSDDGVSDTPNTIGWRSCSLSSESCGSLDNVQNYMDYAGCRVMFTKGQAARMRAALTSTVAERNNLITAQNHKFTGISELLEANWSKSKLIFCEGEEVDFLDASFYGQNEWQWTFDGGFPSSSTVSAPVVRYDSVGSYSVSLEVSNGQESVVSLRTQDVHVVPKQGFFTPYREGFENPTYMETRWNIVNFDKSSFYGWDVVQNISASGKWSLRNNNIFSESGRIDHFVSSSMDWSSFEECEVDFNIAFRQFNQDNADVLRLYTSHDCGETWNIRWAKTGNALATGQPTSNVFTPTPGEFRTEEVFSFQPEDFVDNLMLRFEFVSNGGNQLYLDDIFVAGVYKRTPVLNYPKDLTDSLDQNVLLDWKPILGIGSYELQLDTSADFNSPLLMNESKAYLGIEPFEEDSEFQTENLIPGQRYFWRVRSIHTGVPSDWSSAWEFRVSPTGLGDNFVKPEVVPINIGVDELEGEMQLSLFPNPISSGQMLEFESNFQIDNIRVIDLRGSILLEKFQPESSSIPTQQLSPGVYWLQVGSKEHTLVRKFILN